MSKNIPSLTEEQNYEQWEAAKEDARKSGCVGLGYSVSELSNPGYFFLLECSGCWLITKVVLDNTQDSSDGQLKYVGLTALYLVYGLSIIWWLKLMYTAWRYFEGAKGIALALLLHLAYFLRYITGILGGVVGFCLLWPPEASRFNVTSYKGGIALMLFGVFSLWISGVMTRSVGVHCLFQNLRRYDLRKNS